MTLHRVVEIVHLRPVWIMWVNAGHRTMVSVDASDYLCDEGSSWTHTIVQ